MALTSYNPSSSWLTRPRSADPYIDNDWIPSTYPPALRPGYGNSSEYLAGLWPAVNATGLDEDLVEDWVYHCPDLNRDYNNSLTRQDVMEAFLSIIALVRYADCGQLQTGVSHELLLDLETAMQHDQAELFPHNRRVTFEAQHLFRALSYASHCFRSVAIGRVLHSFFTQQVQWITRNNCRRALWQWCRAITDSAMANALKQDCISRLHILRPDVFVPDNARCARSSVRELSHLVRELIDIMNGDYPSRRLQVRPSHHNSHHRARWPDRDDSPIYQSGREERKDRDNVRNDLQYHEEKAERSRRKLARMGTDYGSSYKAYRPKPYGQRRSLLKDAWSTSNLWSGSDDD